MKRILFLAIFTLIISAACSSSPDVMDTAIDKQKELVAYEKATSEIANDAKAKADADAKAKEERLAQEEEDRKIHDEEDRLAQEEEEDRLAQEEEDRLAQEEEERKTQEEEEEDKKNQEANTPKTLESGISTDDPQKDEIDMFKRIVSENTGPACNIYGIAPCPEWPNFIKTKPSKDDIPVYKETSCEGKFNSTEYLIKTPKEAYIDCLINVSKSDAKPYVIQGAQMDPKVKEAVLEAQQYGAALLGNWGPLLNVFVRYGEPDLEYIASQECLYRSKYSDYDYDVCYEYQYWWYRTFDDCCGGLHGTPNALAPVRFQSMTYNGPDKQYESQDILKSTLHEYIHVWQSAFKVHPHETRCSDEANKLCELGNGPLWLEEGSAEYFAVYFAEKKAWSNLRLVLTEQLNSAHDVYDKWGFTLKNSHNRGAKDKLDQHECNCGGAITFNMGIWGIAWLAHKSKSNDGFLKEFYPRVAYIGYQQAFENAFGLTLDEFYNEFALWFDQTPKSEKLKIIDVISKY